MKSESNKEELERLSQRLHRTGDSIKFAGVVSLTRTAKHGQSAVWEAMEEQFTQRNKWSKRSIRINPARKEDASPFAEVYALDEYLKDQELGGTRETEGEPAVPLNLFSETNVKEGKVIPRYMRASNLLAGKRSVKQGRKPFVATTKKTKQKFLFIRKTDERNPIVSLYLLDAGKSQYEIESKPFFFDATQEAFEKRLDEEYDKAWKQYVLKVKI